MENQIELGYRLATDIVDGIMADHADRVLRDDEANGGRVVVVSGIAVPGVWDTPAAMVFYLCTDAQAWGTLTVCGSVAEAAHEADRILATLSETATA